MSSEEKPLQRLAAWAGILAGALLTASVGLIALASVWEGFQNIHRHGSWVPITAGTLVFGLSVWIYVRAAIAIYRRLNKEESLEL